MWIKRFLLLLSFLLLFAGSAYTLSDLQDRIIKTLQNDITICLGELTVLKGQRAEYKKRISELSKNKDSNELLVVGLKSQVIVLKKLVVNLNKIIENKEKLLSKLQAEINVLTIQLPGLRSDLSEARNISADLEKNRNKYKIGFYIEAVIVAVLVIVTIAK